MSRDYTFSTLKANLFALGLLVPITLLYLVPWGWFHDWAAVGNDISNYFTVLPFFIISLIAGTIIHELIHAVCWVLMCEISWTEIHFGFKWSTLTPYVHCSAPLEAGSYRWGIAMPGIILGVLPYIVALLTGNGWLLGFSLLFTLAAGGDILMLWIIRKVPSGTSVKDHPDLVGCQVMTEK